MNIIDYRAKCPNHSPRPKNEILAIVNHITEGSKTSVLDWFCNAKSQASAHFLVCKDGTIYQFVDCYDKSWACGNIKNPSSDLVKSKGQENPNNYTINIECESFGEALTPAQFKSLVELHKKLLAEFKTIQCDRQHILGHYEIDSVTRPNDPGGNFPWQPLMNELINIDKIEEWKINIIKQASSKGLIQDCEEWIRKANEPAPVWMVLAVANQLTK